MTFTETVKVLSNNIVNDKFNQGAKVRVVNVATNNGKEAIWDRTVETLAYIKPNTYIEVIRGSIAVQVKIRTLH